MTEQERLCACAVPMIRFYLANGRDLPWRRTRDPYRVLISEIMLQQTRVETVKSYYARFLSAFPTPEALADAPEEQVLKLWEGLGYYSRARNLQKTAQTVTAGGFPRTYESLLALPGVGPYTAAAIASNCFSLPCPAVDGNVLRLCSRLLCDETPIGDRMKHRYAALLCPAYEQNDPGTLTQALMELGATLCGPGRVPDCVRCPVSSLCLARAHEMQAQLPVRAEKAARRREQKSVFLLRCGQALALRKRPDRGLLASLWELPNVKGLLSEAEAAAQAAAWGVSPVELRQVVTRSHIFTHVEWEMRGISFSCAEESAGFVWATPEDLRERLPLPTAFRQFL